MQESSIEPTRRPRVLVLLATYNGELWLTEQVESILAQEGVSVEIHIGDDNSKDGTLELIASRWGDDKRVRLRPHAASSGSAGANFRRMLKESNLAGFDFVAFADQDDFWQPGKLKAAIQALRDNDAFGYSCAVQAFWPDGRQQVLGQIPSGTGADFLFEGAGQGCTFVLHPELARRVQQFCIEFPRETEALHYHDWLVYLLSQAWNLRWHFDPLPWLRYRQHGGNEIGSRGRISSVVKRLELIRDGWYKRQIAAASGVFMLANQSSGLVRQFTNLLSGSDTLKRRMRLAVFFLRHGRRRFSDRIVMMISAAAGWT
jgi:rhamnosyltransferase